MTSIQKQLTYIRDIIDTLGEATDHLTSLVKQRELLHCTNMLTTITEGFEAVKGSLNTSDENLNEQMAKLEQYILMMAQNLEQDNFIKIQEILQFSFTPELRKFKDTFTEVYGEVL
mgnify:FL=1